MIPVYVRSMATRKRYSAEQQQAIVDDYRTWQETGVGTVEDVWAKHGISKEGGYNVLRRAGVKPGKPDRFGGMVPLSVVQMMLESSRLQIEDYRQRIHDLEVELDKLRRRPVK